MGKKLSDDDLISIVRREEQTANQWQDAELLGPRQSAFDYYNRDPKTFGVEEGQSSVVTSEFADTVEGVMPGLMRVFASGDEIAKFTPIEEQDERWAKEATQFVPHVLMRENDGYRILYWFFKDVLMYRLAVATVDVDEVEKTKREPIEGWTEEQMAFRAQAEEEQGATDVAFDVEQDQAPEPLAAVEELGAPALSPTFSGTVTITRKKKLVTVANVASEDLLAAPANLRDIDQASFLGYRKRVTSSELRLLGLSQDEIDNLPSDRRSSPEEDQRQSGQTQFSGRKDDQRELWLVVGYVMVDMEGDGISEMWRVVYAHAGGNTPSGALIEKSKWEDGEAPITIGSAILMSHSIVGRSLFDQTQDLQDIGTVLTRGMLDNVYLTNRPRPMINGRVNINSVLDMTPGMPAQIDGNGNPAENISWLQYPSIIEPALKALGYLENKRDQRTGTSRIGNNMDSDALSDASRMTKGGTSMVMSVAQERQELMANVLAATAITRLMRHIYRAIKRAADGPAKYYAKGEWQQCDPTKWPDDMHLIVNVGTSNKQQEQMNLLGIGSAQEKIGLAQGGFNGPMTLEHIFNTGRKLAEASGFRATTQFFPSEKDVTAALAKIAQEGPQVPPEVQAEQAKTQGAIEVQKAQLAGDLQQLQAEQQINTQKLHEEAQLKGMEMAAKREMDEIQRQIKMEEIQLKREEMQLKREEMAHKRAELGMQAEGAARDQHHERQMARAKTEQGVVDAVIDHASSQDSGEGDSKTADPGASLAEAMRESIAASRETAQAQQETAKTMAQATTVMANAISQLAEHSQAETEIVRGPDGKVMGARRKPRSLN